MEPHYADATVTLHHGDCLDVLRSLPDNSVDSVVTDPPYGLEFMGKAWDSFKVPTGGAGFSQDGMGKGFKALPSFSGSPNPTCRNCKGMQRGQDRPGFTRCRCDAPDFPNVRRAQSAAFGDWCELWATECLRVLKPGGHMLAFGGTRTWHRLTVAAEDAGFEIRDSIAWLYGSGFPKSLDVSKAIDKRGGNAHLAAEIAAAIKDSRLTRGWTTGQADRHFCGGSTNWTWFEGRKGECRPPTPDTFARIVEEWPELAPVADKVAEVERDAIGSKRAGMGSGKTFGMLQSEGRNGDASQDLPVTAPATPAAEQWQGWGTALKPAFEPIVVARKPLTGTVASNVTQWGTGALNIDGCRIATDERIPNHHGTNGAAGLTFGTRSEYVPGSASPENTHDKGRWPANVILDESQAEALDEQSGTTASKAASRGERHGAIYGGGRGPSGPDTERGHDDVGGASRFMYVAKADQSERPRVNGTAHPTVKPIDLMRWLVRLVTPPGGTVLEPFAGSGTTVEACIVEGFHCIAIEREADYLPLIEARIARRRDPVKAITLAGEDLGLFGEVGA